MIRARFEDRCQASFLSTPPFASPDHLVVDPELQGVVAVGVGEPGLLQEHALLQEVGDVLGQVASAQPAEGGTVSGVGFRT